MKNKIRSIAHHLLILVLLFFVIALPVGAEPTDGSSDIYLFKGIVEIRDSEANSDEHIANYSHRSEIGIVSDYTVTANRKGIAYLSSYASFESLKANNAIIFNAFGEKNYYITIEDVNRDNNTYSLRGKVEDSQFGLFVMSVVEGQALVSLHLPEENLLYSLIYSPVSKNYYLFEQFLDEVEQQRVYYPPLTLTPPDEEKLEELLLLPDDGNQLQDSQLFIAEYDNDIDEQSIYRQSTQPATVDVLIVYTPAARTWAGSTANVNNMINTSIQQANAVLQNSQTGITLRLVHTAEVTYTESGNSTDIGRLRNPSDGYMDNVHALRNQYNADLVALFNSSGNAHSWGGVASLYQKQGYPSWEWAAENLAFSVSNIQGYDKLLPIHEWGHNFGADHHRDQVASTGPGPNTAFGNWAAGHLFQIGSTRYVTVMSYTQRDLYKPGTLGAGGTTNHTRIPHFSNPNVNYNGVPTGSATLADNARVLRESKHVIASYRSASPTTPAVPTLVSPANGATVPGNSVTFSWNASSGADRYQMRIRPVGTSWNELAVTTSTSETRTAFPNDGTQYEWAVRAGNGAGQWSNWSPTRTFTNGTGSSAPAVPTLVSPANGANVVGTGSDSRITFNWNTSSGADRYQMRIRPFGGNWQESSVTPDTSRSFTGFLNNGTQFEWAVRAGNNANQWSNWSSSRTFTNSQAATTGSIQVGILPAGARTAGAKWRLTTGSDTSWKNHNATISNLPAGSYTIRFKAVSGWRRPANIKVTVGTGLVTRTGTYQSSFIFNHNFNNTNGYHGWVRMPQNRWSLNARTLVTAGQANRFVNAYNPRSYNNFDYQVRMRRVNSPHSLNAVIIRAGNTIGASARQIYPAYRFGYTNAGRYNIYRHNANGTYTEIQGWTASSAINRNGWNTLRVVANGNNFRCFINGTLVRTFTDSTFRSGRVGVAMWRSTSDPSATRLLVDWARLSQLAAGSAAAFETMETIDPEQHTLNEAAQNKTTAGVVDIMEEDVRFEEKED